MKGAGADHESQSFKDGEAACSQGAEVIQGQERVEDSPGAWIIAEVPTVGTACRLRAFGTCSFAQ